MENVPLSDKIRKVRVSSSFKQSVDNLPRYLKAVYEVIKIKSTFILWTLSKVWQGVIQSVNLWIPGDFGIWDLSSSEWPSYAYVSQSRHNDKKEGN